MDCATLNFTFPRPGRALVLVAGQCDSPGLDLNTGGQCGLSADGTPVATATPGASSDAHAGGFHTASLALQAVTGPLPAGAHTFRLRCSETYSDWTLPDATLAAILLGSG